MDLLNQYFSSLVFFRVEKKEEFTVYAAAINSSYGDGRKQYVLAVVPSNEAILEKARIASLPWKNLQTRVLETRWGIPPQIWTVPRNLPNPIFTLTGRDGTSSSYHLSWEGDLLELVLLNDPRKRSTLQYHDKMNLIAALSTFRSSISHRQEDPLFEFV